MRSVPREFIQSFGGVSHLVASGGIGQVTVWSQKLVHECMATQSGLHYKHTISGGTEQATIEQTLKVMGKMMEQMMEDRRKRDKELASERETREWEADWRAKEVEKQMDALMKLVGESHKAVAPATVPMGG